MAHGDVDDCQLQERRQQLRNRPVNRHHSEVGLVRTPTAAQGDGSQRIRRPLGGGRAEVEIDESFIGGDPKNWHLSRREKHRKEVRPERVREYQNRFTHKTSVIGMLDRESRQIRAKVVPNVKRETLQKEILSTIEPGSRVYTDQAVAYNQLQQTYIHETVNHAVEYVRGNVHTNGLESFWSLTKRNLAGTYVCVEPFHLDRYLAEQVFRFNHRKEWNDLGRFHLAMSGVAGKRLTYAELTGANGAH